MQLVSLPQGEVVAGSITCRKIHSHNIGNYTREGDDLAGFLDPLSDELSDLGGFLDELKMAREFSHDEMSQGAVLYVDRVRVEERFKVGRCRLNQVDP
jgi:hypothetical protein